MRRYRDSEALNGWYYVVGQDGKPFIQERVDAVVKAHYDNILAKGEYLVRICDATHEYRNEMNDITVKRIKPSLVGLFTVEQDGNVIFELKDPVMIAAITAKQLML